MPIPETARPILVDWLPIASILHDDALQTVNVAKFATHFNIVFHTRCEIGSLEHRPMSDIVDDAENCMSVSEPGLGSPCTASSALMRNRQSALKFQWRETPLGRLRISRPGFGSASCISVVQTITLHSHQRLSERLRPVNTPILLLENLHLATPPSSIDSNTCRSDKGKVIFQT